MVQKEMTIFSVLQLKLQQRRTREELVSQGIMPPLKSPAAFHEQRKSLERARTEDYLKRKIRSRPERSELVRMHILEETSAEPSLQAKQLQLKRARLADDLNDKISHRPGPIELVHKNILPVDCSLQHSLLDSQAVGGESSSLDEDSSDALSPDQLTNHDSPLGPVPQLSPSEMLGNGDVSPSQFLTQPPVPPPPPPPPPPTLMNGLDSSPSPKLTNGTTATPPSRPTIGQSKAKPSSEKPPHRPKKAKDNKPKVKKLKYHQYIPPDQKADKEPPPQLDSSYAKILQQQQLFLQLQILSQQQQHYNYHTILPAPPKPPAEQTSSANPGPSPSRSVSTTTATATSNQSGPSRSSQTALGGAKPSTLPTNLDEFKVAELKQELKLRGLTVSGTKNDLLERLRNYQEQTCGGTGTPKNGPSQGTAQPASTTPSAQSGETGAKMAPFSLAQTPTPGRVMRFGSTSSSPPLSPTPSERSLAGMSPDETSCSGDMFGEMVSSPLTQLTLQQSPQPLPQVKEETQGQFHTSCSLSKPTLASSQQPSQPPEILTVEMSSLDKDQMLQEKDKQIEELTRMLRQKQQLVESLRSQLEQGKDAGDRHGTSGGGTQVSEVKPQTLIKASAIQPPTLPNGMLLRVKKELETEERMEGVAEEPQTRRLAQPTQCSQETLLKLQQIHRLQVQQAEQQKQLKLQQIQMQKAEAHKPPQKASQGHSHPKTEAQILLQQQQLHQLIIQQTQHKLTQQKLAQQKVAQKNQSKQSQSQVQAQQHQQKNQAQLKQVQVQVLSQAQTVPSPKPAVTQAQQKKQNPAPVTTQQITPVFISQQNGTQLSAQTISLDLIKSSGTPTLVTDGNGNHYLIALTNHATEGQNGVSSLGKTNGRITLQRLQSTPSKLPSQTATGTPSPVTQSKDSQQPEPVSQPIKKGQRTGLHLDTNVVPEPSLSISAPPSLRPFFDELSDSDSQSTILPPLKENGLSCQQMDDLFDILLKSGELPGFKANPDPSLAHLQSHPSSPPSPPSPHYLSPPSPPEPTSLSSSQPTMGEPCSVGSGRLEDFLESTTGAPLLGVGTDGDLTLIDDLHNQMLSTPSILDHPPSPMDTSDLGFSPHPAALDFGDANLDSMDWLDISMGGGSTGGGSSGTGGAGDGGTSLTPLVPQTPPSVFSADFLDSTDLQLHWDSCL